MESNEGMFFNISTSNPEKKKISPEKHISPVPTAKESKQFSNKNKTASQNIKSTDSAKQKSAQDPIHSSLFKSNPEVQPLIVRKQDALSEPLFSTKTFENMNLHPHLVSCLKSRLDIVRMTKVQEDAIPILLGGDDALIKSATGSGKTLAYAVPIVQKLREIEPKIKRADGVLALIIVPTRELAIQCFDSFSTLTKSSTWIVPGYLIGGEKKKAEKSRLRKGINILISTPGRLLDHLDTTSCLSLKNISWLVIDEADKLLEEGFGDSVKRILNQCNPTRNSVLLSATLSKEVENLAGVSLSNPIRLDASAGKDTKDFQDFVIPVNLKQFVAVVPSKLRLVTLSAFIIDNCMKGSFKALIFLCSQNSVDFHHSLLNGVLGPILKSKSHKCKFFKLHGNMKQEDRTEIFNTFRTVKEGVLFCTDVAARGLDLPQVDWIVQYSPPSSTEIYVHRVGRTARIGKRGSALLFLLPSENKFSHLLAEHRIDFEEIESVKLMQSLLLISDEMTSKKKITAEDSATILQTKYEDEVYSEEELHKSAKDAFASYVRSYASYPKDIRFVLPFKALHLGHIAKSFCLREAPSNLGYLNPFLNKKSHFERKSSDSQRKSSDTFVQRKSGIHPQKRKLPTVVSEFDSGLSYMTEDFVKNAKKKKRKH